MSRLESLESPYDNNTETGQGVLEREGSTVNTTVGLNLEYMSGGPSRSKKSPFWRCVLSCVPSPVSS